MPSDPWCRRQDEGAMASRQTSRHVAATSTATAIAHDPAANQCQSGRRDGTDAAGGSNRLGNRRRQKIVLRLPRRVTRRTNRYPLPGTVWRQLSPARPSRAPGGAPRSERSGCSARRRRSATPRPRNLGHLLHHAVRCQCCDALGGVSDFAEHFPRMLPQCRRRVAQLAGRF
jgi:hypothetical protein